MFLGKKVTCLIQGAPRILKNSCPSYRLFVKIHILLRFSLLFNLVLLFQSQFRFLEHNSVGFIVFMSSVMPSVSTIEAELLNLKTDTFLYVWHIQNLYNVSIKEMELRKGLYFRNKLSLAD